MQSELTVDGLAQEIRRVDGNHSLGAGALAEALMPFLTAAQAYYEQRIRSAVVDVPVDPVAWIDDGSLRAGSDKTVHRVVTDAQKRDMPTSVAASFTIPLYAFPTHREGEDSAEVEQMVGSHEIIDFLYKHGDLTYSAAARAVQLLTGNGYGFTSSSKARKESLLTMRKALNKIADMIDAEDADLDDAISIATTALAATRSASASTANGCADV